MWRYARVLEIAATCFIDKIGTLCRHNNENCGQKHKEGWFFKGKADEVVIKSQCRTKIYWHHRNNKARSVILENTTRLHTVSSLWRSTALVVRRLRTSGKYCVNNCRLRVRTTIASCYLLRYLSLKIGWKKREDARVGAFCPSGDRSICICFQVFVTWPEAPMD